MFAAKKGKVFREDVNIMCKGSMKLRRTYGKMLIADFVFIQEVDDPYNNLLGALISI